MTEAEWLACEEPAEMLTFIRERVSDRKLRLLACAFCREVWYQLANDLCRHTVALAERMADDTSALIEMTNMRDTARETSVDARGFSHSEKTRKGASYNAALMTATGQMWHIQTVVGSTQLLATRLGFRLHQRALARDIFGNPFRPVTFAPEWRTDTVRALATQMYESRDFGAMPILADALQDAGCDNDDILSHCRSDRPHVRGCWVADLVLGKK